MGLKDLLLATLIGVGSCSLDLDALRGTGVEADGRTPRLGAGKDAGSLRDTYGSGVDSKVRIEPDTYSIIKDGGSIDSKVAEDSGVPEDMGRVEPYTADENCLALFHFDGSLENDCMDVYGVENRGDPAEYREGRFGQARYFNGDSYLWGAGNMTLDLGNELTVEAWIKPDLERGSYQGVFGSLFHTAYADGDFYRGFILWVYSSGIALTLGVDGEHVTFDIAVVLPTDRFTHVAGTYDGEVFKLFVDHEMVREGPREGVISRNDLSSVHYSIGADRNGENAFIGTIDELRVSKVVRGF